MNVLIAVGGMLILTGLALGVALLAGVQLPQRATATTPRSDTGQARRWHREQLVAVPIGVIAMLATGWVAAGLGAAALVLLAPSLLRPSAASKAHIARLEALASWTRRLADLLASGAASTLQDALRRAALTSPTPIATQTAALASRMGPQGLEPALRQFAKQIADPVGDHIAMALIVRHRHGGTGVADVLSALSLDVDEQVRMRRGILSEQTKQIGNVRAILAVTVGFWVLLAIFAADYMAPYRTLPGQIVLGVIVAGFGFTLAWIARLSRPVVGARFLQDLDESQHPPTGPGPDAAVPR